MKGLHLIADDLGEPTGREPGFTCSDAWREWRDEAYRRAWDSDDAIAERLIEPTEHRLLAEVLMDEIDGRVANSGVTGAADAHDAVCSASGVHVSEGFRDAADTAARFPCPAVEATP